MDGGESPQNIYDDPEFLAGYSRLERFGSGWTRAVEHRDFMRLLPDVERRRVLDLGCGAGQLAVHLAEAGAADVVGVDISARMPALATAERGHPRVTYLRARSSALRRLAASSYDRGGPNTGRLYSPNRSAPSVHTSSSRMPSRSSVASIPTG